MLVDRFFAFETFNFNPGNGDPLQPKYKTYLWDFRNAGSTPLLNNEG